MEKSAFSGEYNNTLDEKGRIMFPAKLRCLLPGSQIVITRGIDRCLWIFPPEEWALLSEKVMQSASLFQANSRLILRRLIAPAQELWDAAEYRAYLEGSEADFHQASEDLGLIRF